MIGNIWLLSSNCAAMRGLLSFSLTSCDIKYVSGLNLETLLYKLSMQFKDENPSSICETPPNGNVKKLKTKSIKSSPASTNKNSPVDFLLTTFTDICPTLSDFTSLILNSDWFLCLNSRGKGLFLKKKSVKGVFVTNDNLRISTTYKNLKMM
jgi:hypothetical protein